MEDKQEQLEEVKKNEDAKEGIASALLETQVFKDKTKALLNESIEQVKIDNLYNSLDDRFENLKNNAPKLFDEYKSRIEKVRYDEALSLVAELDEHKRSFDSYSGVKKSYNNSSTPEDYADLIDQYERGRDFSEEKNLHMDKSGFVIKTKLFEDAIKDLNLEDLLNLSYEDSNSDLYNRSADKFREAEQRLSEGRTYASRHSLQII